MKREPAWRRYLRFWGASPARDVGDEFRFHLETKTRELQSAGLSLEDARREAIRQFGPVAALGAECIAISRSRQRQASRLESFYGWANDLRYAVRTLRKAKSSSAAAILILAIGIGGATAIFTVMDRLLYEPLPVPHPTELALISHWTPAPNGTHIGVTFTQGGYEWLRDRQQVFSQLAAETNVNAVERRLHQRIERPARGTLVTANFFELLGAPPLAGRWLAEADGVAHVAVAGYRFAARRYEQPTDAVGQTVYLNDLPFTIVGVMPPGFYGLQKGYDPDLYLSLRCATDVIGGIDLATGAYLRAIGRLKHGVSRTRAESDLQVLWRQFLATGATRDDPQNDRIGCDDGSRGYSGTEGERQRSLTILGAVVALLLLIGCANVGCLWMARGAARQHETAVRLSLGAGRWRILRQSALESVVLALAGGAGSLLVAHWSGRLLLAAFHWEKRPIDLAPDARVLAFALSVSVLSAVLLGIAPALQLLRGGRIALHRGESVASFSSGKVLVVLEVALSLVLVAGAAVFTRSFQNLRAVPTGFVPAHVAVVRVARNTDDDSDKPLARDAAALADILRRAPNVQSAGLSSSLAFNDGYVSTSARSTEDSASHPVRMLPVGPGYFEALRIPLLAGREVTGRDDAQSSRVAVLNESLARQLFPGRNPLGRHILTARAVFDPKPGDEMEVVGIVKDTKYISLAKPAPDIVYTSLLRGPAFNSGVVLEVRSLMPPTAIGALAAARIRDAHLPLRVRSATAMNDEISATLDDDSIRMQASGLFGLLALGLIVSGLYGLIAYQVARRTREIGIRMAVGSSASAIVGIVVRQSLGLVMAGVAIGIPGAVAVLRVLSKMVFGLPPIDFASLAIAAALMTLAGLAASSAPAWKAARLDPMKALRVQ